jgi:ribosomal RNA-processing protein 7
MAKIKQSKSASETKDKAPKQLQDLLGFKVLPVLVNENTRHFLYMREHESKSLIEDSIKGRTLFLLNLPFDTTTHHIKKLFKDLNIAHITFSGSELPVADDFAKKSQVKKLTKQEKLIQKEEAAHASKQLRRLLEGGASAHVVFSKEAELEQALDTSRVERKWPKDAEDEQPLGLGSKFIHVVFNG